MRSDVSSLHQVRLCCVEIKRKGVSTIADGPDLKTHEKEFLANRLEAMPTAFKDTLHGNDA